MSCREYYKYIYYFYDMNATSIKILFVAIFISISAAIYAQNPQQDPKTPEEIAMEQAKRFQENLKLSDYQLFHVDSTLQTNFVGQQQEFEKMRMSGLQSQKSYQDVYDKWRQKTEDAFEKILDRGQFEKFLKLSGMPAKERKKRLANMGQK